MAFVPGIGGSFLGGLVLSLLFGDGLSLEPSGIVGSVLGAVAFTAIWTTVKANRARSSDRRAVILDASGARGSQHVSYGAERHPAKHAAYRNLVEPFWGLGVHTGVGFCSVVEVRDSQVKRWWDCLSRSRLLGGASRWWLDDDTAAWRRRTP